MKLFQMIKKFNFRLRLVQKITAIITVILIVPMILIFTYYFNAYRKSLTADAHDNLSRMLDAMDTVVEDNIDSILNVFTQLNYRQELTYFLNGRNKLSTREQNYYISSIHQELTNIRYLYPNRFYHISIFSSNNQITDYIEWQYPISELSKEPYFDDITGNPEKIVFGQIRKTNYQSSNIDLKDLNLNYTDTLVLPAYLKVHDLNSKELIGVVEIEMRANKFMNVSTLRNVDEEFDYLMLDSNNSIVYQTSKLNTTTFEKQKLDQPNSIIEVLVGKKTYMMAYSSNQRTGLTIATIVSKQKALSFAFEMMGRIVLVLVLGILVIILLVHWVIRKVLQRLLILDDKLLEIESGKFDAYIHDDSYDDEIAHIGRSFNRMASRLDGLIRSTIEKEQAKNEAEMRALQAQINPHFLYNTLENMRMQCEIDDYPMGESLEALGNLFRYSIKWGSNEVPFEMEWSNLKNYIAIMKMRFGDDIAVVIDCESGLQDIIIPKMILQPLVENCFQHGFQNVLPPWSIYMKAYLEDNKLILWIEDNGSGISLERLNYIRSCLNENKSIESNESMRNSIGIVNVKKRIEMICRKGSSIEIESEAGSGTRIVISIVLEEEVHD